jgi:hypothetical protein
MWHIAGRVIRACAEGERQAQNRKTAEAGRKSVHGNA